MTQRLTLEKAEEIMERNAGHLDLRGADIDSLPDGIMVGGDLNLSGAQIASLPKGLLVGGNLNLSDSRIASLPKGLLVGKSLNLCGAPISFLPEGLAVGGWLELRDSRIASLPRGLMVGGQIDLRGTGIKNAAFKRLRQGDYLPNQYLYADGVLTPIKGREEIGGYLFYIGRIKRHNVATDGKYFARCGKLEAGIQDIKIQREIRKGR